MVLENRARSRDQGQERCLSPCTARPCQWTHDLVPGVGRGDTQQPDPDMGDCASDRGRAPSHPPGSKGLADHTHPPAACGMGPPGSASPSEEGLPWLSLPGPASPLCLASGGSRCFCAHPYRCLDPGCGQLSAFCLVTLLLSPWIQPCCKNTECHPLSSNPRAKCRRKEV